MYQLKLILYAVLGFTIPVLIAVETAPRLFKYTSSIHSRGGDLRAKLQDAAAGTQPAEAKPEPADVRSSENEHPVGDPVSFLKVVSDDSLNPQSKKYFVASVHFKLGSPPRTGKRQRLLCKYDTTDANIPGWALALRRTDTSLRPEVWWQDGKGQGGWFTFDRMKLDRHRWYALTLVARNNDLLSLYLQNVPEPGGNASDAMTVSSSEADADEEATDLGVKFLGGYNISGTAAASTAADLQFVPLTPTGGDFKGAMTKILIAQPDRLPPNQTKLRELIAGGSESLAGKFSEDEISLWIDSDGQDHSKYHRTVSQYISRS